MARSFNGSTDVINCGTSALLLPSTAFSISFHFNVSSFPAAYAGLVTRYNANDVTKAYYNIYVKSTGTMAYYIQHLGSSTNIDPGLGTVSTSTWNHCAITYDTTNGLKTFLKGINDGTNPVAASMSPDAGWNLRIGAEVVFANRFFNGRIANVAIWNTVLTTNEILALKNGILPFTIRRQSIVGYWPLDGLSSPEPDLSGNTLNGALTGTALADGPPITLFTPKLPLLAPAGPSAAQIYSFNQASAHIGQRITNIGY